MHARYVFIISKSRSSVKVIGSKSRSYERKVNTHVCGWSALDEKAILFFVRIFGVFISEQDNIQANSESVQCRVLMTIMSVHTL